MSVARVVRVRKTIYSPGRRGSGVEGFLARERARNSAHYQEVPPAPDLAGVIACGWVRVVRRGKAGAAQAPIVPDGCADILVCDDGAPFLVGPDSRTRWMSLPEGLVITGLRFRPGALRAALGLPVGELLDSNVALADFARNAQRLQSDLHGAGTLASRLAVLEAWVRGRLDVSAHDAHVVTACRRLATDCRAEISSVAAALGWNVRTLHREFVAACGFGPKHMQRVLRVQQALRLAHASPALRLSDISAGVGFADQAHMSRDFRAITGFTPRDYIALAEPKLGRWMDADWEQN